LRIARWDALFLARSLADLSDRAVSSGAVAVGTDSGVASRAHRQCAVARRSDNASWRANLTSVTSPSAWACGGYMRAVVRTSALAAVESRERESIGATTPRPMTQHSEKLTAAAVDVAEASHGSIQTVSPAHLESPPSGGRRPLNGPADHTRILITLNGPNRYPIPAHAP
jgi:hypothetical protein